MGSLKDPTMDAPADGVLRVAQLALSCTVERTAARPSMAHVANELQAIREEWVGKEELSAAVKVDTQACDTRDNIFHLLHLRIHLDSRTQHLFPPHRLPDGLELVGNLQHAWAVCSALSSAGEGDLSHTQHSFSRGVHEDRAWERLEGSGRVEGLGKVEVLVGVEGVLKVEELEGLGGVTYGIQEAGRISFGEYAI
ncbi:unnamed protein product [Closterium sp. NIES-64]|nr:unnamed protein product [Closterium sp. NIES-64]